MSREIHTEECEYMFNDFKLIGKPTFKLNLKTTESEALGADKNGAPIFIRNIASYLIAKSKRSFVKTSRQYILL